jgi:hypothetical protein
MLLITCFIFVLCIWRQLACSGGAELLQSAKESAVGESAFTRSRLGLLALLGQLAVDVGGRSAMVTVPAAWTTPRRCPVQAECGGDDAVLLVALACSVASQLSNTSAAGTP